MDEKKLLVEKVIKMNLEEIISKNGKPAITIFGDFAHLHIDLTGKSTIGNTIRYNKAGQEAHRCGQE